MGVLDGSYLGGAGVGGNADRSGDEPTIIRSLAYIAVRDLWSIARISFVAAALVIAYVMLFVGRDYASTASFVPKAATQVNQIDALATQLGMSMAESPSSSPDFYVELIKGEDVLRRVVDAKYTSSPDKNGQPRNLIEIYKFDKNSPDLAMSNAVKRLAASIQTGTLRRAGLVRFTVVAPGAALAKDIADTILRKVDDFDQRVRQTTAASERAFVEKRLVILRAETQASEDTLERWLENNRQYQNFPGLLLTYQRLARHITEHSAMYNALVLNYEQARVDEVRNTPVLMVVQPPRVPARGRSKGTLVWAALAALLIGIAELLRRLVLTPVEVASWDPVLLKFNERLSGLKKVLRIKPRPTVRA